MTTLKKLVLALLIPLFLACMVMWGVVNSLKPDTIKAYVNEELQRLTNESGQIKGDVSWHVFPRPRIKMTHVQIGDPRSASPFAITIDNLLLNLKLTQLLRGNLVFSELNVDGFTVEIDQRANRISPPTQAKPPRGIEPLAHQFAIKNVMLSHGKLILTRDQSQVIFSGLQIGAEQFNLRQQSFPFQLKSKVTVNKKGQPFAHTQFLFKGNTRLTAQWLSDAELKSLPLFGQLTLLDLSIQQLKVDRLQANTSYKEGILDLNPLTLSLYRGESVGDLHYDPQQARLQLNQTATDLDSNRLIHDLFARKLLKGRLDFSLHTAIDLHDFKWPQSITGKGNITVKDGTLMAMNVNQMIQETNARINSLFLNQSATDQPAKPEETLTNAAFFKGNTDFKLMASQYRIENGLLNSHLFVLQTNRLQLKGGGQMNLLDYSLSGTLLAKVIFKNENADKIQQLLGGAIPLLVKGTLIEPLILPDMKKINPLLTQTFITETLTMPVKAVHNQLKAMLH
ncbi:putative asmA protein [Legionella rubrilucens]|uniref:Putative asmA protein n=1 Tax=Legionella rubrilucens TaxID=458 RepID=A0A0W0XW98_9GAMM|nr:AsmA family protein [Legionella rubrilucens]KTD48924.1 putative asmA protein [Legionella rubrilucens]